MLNNEILLIKRLRDKKNHKQYARKIGVTKRHYGKIERGEQPVPDGVDLTLQPSTLMPNELCLLKRRAAKMTQQELSVEVGVSKTWVNRMERGKENCKALCEYWGI